MPAEEESAASAARGLFYPDISSTQGVIALSGLHAVCVKITEGVSYVNPDYQRQVAKAEAAGAYHFAYHFLTDSDPKAQAQHCFANLGAGLGLMVDVEIEPKTGSKPTMQQNIDFIKAYRALGGHLHLNYLPHWYWHDNWGAPSLAPLRDLGALALVSSNFNNFSTGLGWAAYGGWTPTVWQYSDSIKVSGQPCDFNAFLGSGSTNVATLVAELKSLVMTGTIGGKTWQPLTTSGNQTLQQIAAQTGMNPAQILRATATHFGQYNEVLHDFLCHVFGGDQAATAKVPAGAKLWVLK